MTQKRSFSTLSADILIKRQRLPEKPSPIKLTGKYVSLEPIVIARNGHPLFEMPNGTPITLNDRSIDSYDANELIWRYMFDSPFGNVKDFEASLQPYVNTSNGLCFCIFDIASRRQVGIANFMNHLGIAKGTIYHYFKSKEELLEAVVEDIVDQHIKEMNVLIQETSGNALQKIQAFIAASNKVAAPSVLEKLHERGNEAMHTRLLVATLMKQAPMYAKLIQQGCEQGIFQTPFPLEPPSGLAANIQK